jgi:type III secretion protein U
MSEKTEKPTDHRIRQAREDGQVAKSKDFTQVLLMGALVGYTLVAGGGMFRKFAEMMALPGPLAGTDFRSAVSLALTSLVRTGVEIMLPYLLLVIVVGVGSEAAQTGMLVSFKALLPKGDKLNPINNLKQIFGGKAFIEFFKSCLKVVLLTIIVYWVVRSSLDPLVKLPLAGTHQAGALLSEMMWRLFKWTFLAFAVIALADLIWQRHSYIKGLMMSMDEIRQEHKQMEGDPHMKGHRKEVAREIAMGDPAAHTKDASVLVTNPTHIAIALFYKAGDTPLPVVVAKGEGGMAERMKRVAEEHGIPVLQNVPLARGLMRRAEQFQYIPSEFIEAVAQVFLAVRRLKEEQQMQEQELHVDG